MTPEQLLWAVLGFQATQTGIIILVMFKINDNLKDSINKRLELIEKRLDRLEENLKLVK